MEELRIRITDEQASYIEDTFGSDASSTSEQVRMLIREHRQLRRLVFDDGQAVTDE